MAVSPNSGRRARRSSLLLPLLALVLPGCGVTPELSEEEVARAERMLMQPFLRPEVVVCDQLEIEMTPNFYGNNVGASEIDQASAEGAEVWRQRGIGFPADHDLNIKKREIEGGGTVWTYTNLHSQQPMSFRVGAVEFEVIRRATVKVLGGRVEARLLASAGGPGGVDVIDPSSGTEPRKMKMWRRGQLMSQLDTRAETER